MGHSVPVFLVLGNHDGEQPGKGGGDAMALWSNAQRKKYFPNPKPNAFYSGSATPHPKAGLLQNYYAFEWGDALFVALDPYWYGQEPNRGGDNWGRSLGREQYEWLRLVLERSRARFTFVFIHHLVGGETREGRGGAEAAAFFEWGGRDINDRDSFAQKRPGWAAPIHSLLVRRRGGAWWCFTAMIISMRGRSVTASSTNSCRSPVTPATTRFAAPKNTATRVA